VHGACKNPSVDWLHSGVVWWIRPIDERSATPIASKLGRDRVECLAPRVCGVSKCRSAISLLFLQSVEASLAPSSNAESSFCGTLYSDFGPEKPNFDLVPKVRLRLWLRDLSDNVLNVDVRRENLKNYFKIAIPTCHYESIEMSIWSWHAMTKDAQYCTFILLLAIFYYTIQLPKWS